MPVSSLVFFLKTHPEPRSVRTGASAGEHACLADQAGLASLACSPAKDDWPVCAGRG